MGAGKYDFTKPEFQQLKGITATNNLANINFSTPDLGLTFSGSVKFNKIYTQYNDFSGNTTGITISAVTTNAIAGTGAEICIIGDGVNVISFTNNFIRSINSSDYDNTLNKINLITFLYDGTRYWYSITQNV